MANRKVLINRHTSGSSAPQADSMYLGELAVAHETGKETLFTKNNAGDMVPFISCAQTISIVSGMIESVDVVYDVEKKAGEPYINVETATTQGQKTFTLSTSGVQSEEEFKAYSARTNEALCGLTEAFYQLLDITVTGITGDNIITATVGPDPATSGSNNYSLTHKQALATNGFNKLTTDAYGHVTASTAVATSDIEALGFKTSADTDEEIAELSGATEAISGYAATQISQLSAGTIHDIETLSGNVVEYVKVVSGNIETVINELSAGTLHLSADTHNKIESVYASAVSYTDAAIDALDSSSATTDNRHYVTAITIENGKIVSFGEATDPQLSVESAGTGNVVASITVADHKISYQTASVATSEGIAELSAATIALSAGTVHDFEELSGATEAISGYAHDEIAQLSGATQAISGYAHDEIAALSAGTLQLSADTYAAINQLSGYAHGEIVELSGAVQANETDIDNLSAATLALSAVTLTGVSLNNTPLTVTDHVVSVPVTVSGDGIANATNSGSVADALAVKEYVEDTLSSAVEYKGATGATPSNPAKGDLYIASSDFVVEGSKSAETGDFIIYDGTKWDVIEKNLDGAITGNLTQNTVTLGDSTNSVKSLANGSNGQVLEMVDGAPAWADLPVLSSATTGDGNVVSEITVNDHEITYVKNFTAATNADLEIVSGIVDTFSAATVAEFNSAFTAINTLSADAHNSMIARDNAVFSSAVTYVDEQIDEVYASAVSYADSAITVAIEALDSETAVTEGNYITGIAIKDGKISGITQTALPANVPITATTGAAVDTPSAVLTGVTAGGTDNHNLTFGMSNKVFSAASSDSALTSESALTAVHADAAAKVDSALTVNFATATGSTAFTFDGSQNVTVNISDSATTEEGHYVPATAASAFTAPAGSFLSAVSVDSKNHVLEVAYADLVNSASTAAEADKVANTLSVSGYATSDSSALDTSFAYDGSAAQSLTFGTNGPAGLKSMSMTSAGVVDVEVIDCGEY